MLDLFAGLEAADGGDLRGQGVQARSDLFNVGRRNALFELEQDCAKGMEGLVLREGHAGSSTTYRCGEWP